MSKIITLGTWKNPNWEDDDNAVSIHKNGKVQWLVLKEDENFCFCVSNKLLFCHCWNDNKNKGTQYSNSDIRKYLIKDFYKICFSDEEKKRIVSHKITDVDRIIKDSVFLLSKAEIEQLLNEKERACGYYWWTRTSYNSTQVWDNEPKNNSDKFNTYSVTENDFIRPAIVIRKERGV